MGDYCTFACLGPYKFHTFLLRLLLSPPLTAKCAQLHGGCGAWVGFWVGDWGDFLPLAPPFTADLHFRLRCRGLGGSGGKNTKEANRSLASALPAFPLYVRAVGHLWHPPGIPLKDHPSPPEPPPEPPIPAPETLSHCLYARTVCRVFRLLQVNEFFMLPSQESA